MRHKIKPIFEFYYTSQIVFDPTYNFEKRIVFGKSSCAKILPGCCGNDTFN